MTSDPKGEYDAPLYGPLDNRDAMTPPPGHIRSDGRGGLRELIEEALR